MGSFPLRNFDKSDSSTHQQLALNQPAGAVQVSVPSPPSTIPGIANAGSMVIKSSPPIALMNTSAGEIERFAHEYATTKPAVLRPLIGIKHHRNGAMMFRTLACLPVLTGAWRHRGGGLCRSTGALQNSVLNVRGVQMPEKDLPGVRTLNMRDLGHDLCNRNLDPPIRSLCIYNSNPVVSIPNQQRIMEGLRRDDLFTVVHDLFVTETARYADFVLPATSQIECLDIVPAWGHHYLAMNRPAIAPVGESMSNTGFFRRLAAAMGRTESWLFDSDETLIRTALASLHPWLKHVTYERLWEEEFVRLNEDRDWRPFASGGFHTLSGKARLFSEPMQEAGLDPLPNCDEIRQPRNGELQLITAKTLHFLNSSYANIERHRKREGTLFVELHADDATSRRLTDGDLVCVSNQQGSVVAECCISERVRPGVAWMPFGGFGDAQPRLFGQHADSGRTDRLGRRQRLLRHFCQRCQVCGLKCT